MHLMKSESAVDSENLLPQQSVKSVEGTEDGVCCNRLKPLQRLFPNMHSGLFCAIDSLVVGNGKEL